MKNLVKQTLEHDFDLPQYTDFIKNLFNEIQIQPQEIKVPDNSQEFIKKITFLSDFSDTQKKTIDIYAVELAGGTKVERARSFQRNLISKLLKDNTKDAGLAAFYSKDNPDWRLSFIKLDYKLTDKGVKVEVGTPPKRYSFLVGKTEPSHTAQKQLLPILEDHKNNPLLSDLEEAFSVERVTREFYERYKKLFEDLSKDLKKNKAFRIIAEKENIDIDNFAKKLLGQIVFLYFLQKKGWLGVPQDKTWGQGDKFFLRTLFDKAKAGKQDFYDHYLEHLFYDTLNNPRRDEVDPACSRYFDCKIPFLNGGLFEPDYDWKNTIVYLGNEIFEEIIDTFDLYNFTVKEDEPLEKEVAVDPEMLGKVFENLLPENMRKGRGAYYTPREIVHYMCQESLINHLNTETRIDAEKIRKLIAFKDEDLVNGNGSRKKTLGFSDDETQSLDRALANIKVCDPACGSGAFLVGMLNEIVSARRILEPRSEYKLKKEAIQECIYGVDIDPGAVDIAKLRLWLSLVVDFELRDIEPLPNLDYKIMCGNSLLEELIVGDESIKLFDERLLNLKEPTSNPPQDARQEELKKQLWEKQKELLDLHAKNKLSMSRKKELDSQILAINKELNPKAKKTKPEAYHPVFFVEQADEYFKRLRELHKQFFTEYDPIKKKERRKQIEDIELEFIKSSIKEKVDEFDSKINNLNMQDPGDRKKQAVLMKKKLEYSAIPEQIRNSKTRPYFLWKLNFFEVFQEKGGFDVVIANPPYIFARNSAQKGLTEKDKKYFYENYELAEYQVNLYPLFIEQSVRMLQSDGCLTFITPNNWLTVNTNRSLRRFVLQKSNITLVNFYAQVFESAAVDSSVIFFTNGQSHPVVNLYEFTDSLHFIRKTDCSYFLNQKDHVINIEAFKADGVAELLLKIENCSQTLDSLSDVKAGLVAYEVGKGNPPQSKETKAKRVYHATKKLGKDYYKYLDGRDVCRYIIGWSGEYLKYGENLAAPRTDFSLYSTERILVRQIPAKPPYCIHACIAKDTILNDRNSMNVINLKEASECLLGVINSRLLSFWFMHKFGKLQRGIFPQFKVNELAMFPIARNREPYKQRIIQLVKQIMKIKEIDPNAKTEKYDKEIDELVMDIYGLTKEEREIVYKSINP